MRTGCHYLLSLFVCPPVCLPVCVTLIVFTDCENWTRPITTNPGSMEAGEYGLTRGTCFLVCGLELDAVAGLLWISWCVSGRADFSSVFFFRFFFFLRTHTACCKHEAASCLIYLSTKNEARPRERSDRGRFLSLSKKASS